MADAGSDRGAKVARAHSNSSLIKVEIVAGSGSDPNSRVIDFRSISSETSKASSADGSHSDINVGKCIGAMAASGCRRSQRSVAAGRPQRVEDCGSACKKDPPSFSIRRDRWA